MRRTIDRPCGGGQREAVCFIAGLHMAPLWSRLSKPPTRRIHDQVRRPCPHPACRRRRQLARVSDPCARARRLRGGRLPRRRDGRRGARAEVRSALTDIVMPGSTASRSPASPPPASRSLRIMFITGFAAVALSAGDRAPAGAKVLSKPIHLREIVAEVERMIAA